MESGGVGAVRERGAALLLQAAELPRPCVREERARGIAGRSSGKKEGTARSSKGPCMLELNLSSGKEDRWVGVNSSQEVRGKGASPQEFRNCGPLGPRTGSSRWYYQSRRTLR